MQRGILYADSDPSSLRTFQATFGTNYTVVTCRNGKEAIDLLQKEGDRFPLLVVGSNLPDIDGIDLCEKAAAIQPQTVRMILTSFAQTTPMILEAINRGFVHDYIVKPWQKEDLTQTIDKAFEDFKNKSEKIHELEMQAAKIRSLENEIRERYDSASIIGEQSGLREVMQLVKKVSQTDSTVLILGETGTGKELLARAIHERSRRKNGPFVPVHCASLAKTLMESELFGHEKGAFTGADQMHLGRFEIAKGGTLFLDEIGELTEEIQVKLLRVLQEKEIYRVGGNRPISVDVRLVAATHRNLEEMIRSGKFREDLYYRLNVISLKVPPLRERKEDVPALATYFLKKFCQESFKNLSFGPETITYLTLYDWPGNIRELQNMVERAVILTEGPTIDPEDLNLNIEQTLGVEKIDVSKPLITKSLKSRIHEEKIQELSEMLLKAKGNVAEAARMMGIPRTTLLHRLRKYQII